MVRNFNQLYSVHRQNLSSSLIIYFPLFATMNTTYCLDMQFIKMRYSVSVLYFSIFNNQRRLEYRIICINRQFSPPSIFASITQ